MSGRAVFSLLSVLNVLSSLALTYETLNCSPANIPVDAGLGKTVNIESPVVNLTYNRDSLALYLHPDAPYANLFVNESLISVKIYGNGADRSLEFINHEAQYAAEIAGIADVANSSDDAPGSLRDCEFFVSDKPTGRSYRELPTKLEAAIFHAVERCLTAKLCRSLGPMRYDDVLRAKLSPRDFGRVSRTNLAEAVAAADSIVRLVADGYRVASDGVINIPDVKHGVYSASKGTFSGLAGLTRAEHRIVRASPQKFSFTFGIPEGRVVYEQQHAFGLVPVAGGLCANVSDALFNAVVSMDFSRGGQCRAVLQDFTIASGGTSVSYTCGRLSFITNPIMRWFVDAWRTEILLAVGHQLEWTLAAYVRDEFDCESLKSA